MKKFNLLKNIMRSLNWVEDVMDGEVIESPGYTGSYFRNFEGKSISKLELNIMCSLINIILLLSGYNFRICCEAGELRPVRSRRHLSIVDDEIINDLELGVITEINIRRG